ELAQSGVEPGSVGRRYGAIDAGTVPEPVSATVERAERHDGQLPGTLQQPARDFGRPAGELEQLRVETAQSLERCLAELIGPDGRVAPALADLAEDLRWIALREHQLVVTAPSRGLDALEGLGARCHRHVVRDGKHVSVDRAPERPYWKPIVRRRGELHPLVTPLKIVIDAMLGRRLSGIKRRPGRT